MIRLSNISKNYNYSKHISHDVFVAASFGIQQQHSIAVRGRSGSGKSTLLNILSGLDLNYSGQYLLQGTILPKDSKRMAQYRLKNIGIITQNYQLLKDRNVFNNIAFPLRCQNIEENEVRNRVIEILELLDLKQLQKKFPKHLSGGESQRVAIARAIVKKPNLLIADEPTGALDEKSELEILKVFSLLQKQGQTMVIATHSQRVADSCDGEYLINNHKLECIR